MKLVSPKRWQTFFDAEYVGLLARADARTVEQARFALGHAS
jgi:hypothetical protein